MCVYVLGSVSHTGLNTGDDASIWRDTFYSFIQDCYPWYTFSHEATLTNYKITKPIEAHLYGIVYRSDIATSLPETTTQCALLFLFRRTLTNAWTAPWSFQPALWRLSYLRGESCHKPSRANRQTCSHHSRAPDNRKMETGSYESKPRTNTRKVRHATVSDSCTTLDNCTNSYLKSSSFLMWTAGSS